MAAAFQPISKEQLTKNVAAAMLARNAAKKHLDKSKKVTTGKINEVLSFQKTDGKLTADGFYGPNVVAALKFYLQKTSDPSVPPAADKYKNVKVTWVAPQLAKEPDKAKPKATQASTPTPAPAPAPAPKSKLKSKSVTKKSSPAKKKASTVAKAAKKTRKIPAPPPYGQELNTIKPKHDSEEHVVARVNGTKPPSTKPRDVEESIASRQASAAAANAITPVLKEIKKKLVKQDLQQQATSEHRNINKKEAFQREVLTKLSEIQAKITGKGGTFHNTSDERRIVGLIL